MTWIDAALTLFCALIFTYIALVLLAVLSLGIVELICKLTDRAPPDIPE